MIWCSWFCLFALGALSEDIEWIFLPGVKPISGPSRLLTARTLERVSASTFYRLALRVWYVADHNGVEPLKIKITGLNTKEDVLPHVDFLEAIGCIHTLLIDEMSPASPPLANSDFNLKISSGDLIRTMVIFANYFEELQRGTKPTSEALHSYLEHWMNMTETPCANLPLLVAVYRFYFAQIAPLPDAPPTLSFLTPHPPDMMKKLMAQRPADTTIIKTLIWVATAPNLSVEDASLIINMWRSYTLDDPTMSVYVVKCTRFTIEMSRHDDWKRIRKAREPSMKLVDFMIKYIDCAFLAQQLRAGGTTWMMDNPHRTENNWNLNLLFGDSALDKRDFSRVLSEIEHRGGHQNDPVISVSKTLREVTKVEDISLDSLSFDLQMSKRFSLMFWTTIFASGRIDPMTTDGPWRNLVQMMFDRMAETIKAELSENSSQLREMIINLLWLCDMFLMLNLSETVLPNLVRCAEITGIVETMLPKFSLKSKLMINRDLPMQNSNSDPFPLLSYETLGLPLNSRLMEFAVSDFLKQQNKDLLPEFLQEDALRSMTTGSAHWQMAPRDVFRDTAKEEYLRYHPWVVCAQYRYVMRSIYYPSSIGMTRNAIGKLGAISKTLYTNCARGTLSDESVQEKINESLTEGEIKIKNQGKMYSEH